MRNSNTILKCINFSPFGLLAQRVHNTIKYSYNKIEITKRS